MALCLVWTQIVPQVLRIHMHQVQIVVSIPTPALIRTKADEHQMVAPVFIGSVVKPSKKNFFKKFFFLLGNSLLGNRFFY